MGRGQDGLAIGGWRQLQVSLYCRLEVSVAGIVVLSVIVGGGDQVPGYKMTDFSTIVSQL